MAGSAAMERWPSNEGASKIGEGKNRPRGRATTRTQVGAPSVLHLGKIVRSGNVRGAKASHPGGRRCGYYPAVLGPALLLGAFFRPTAWVRDTRQTNPSRVDVRWAAWLGA